jgi:hypothetical protein
VQDPSLESSGSGAQSLLFAPHVAPCEGRDLGAVAQGDAAGHLAAAGMRVGAVIERGKEDERCGYSGGLLSTSSCTLLHLSFGYYGYSSAPFRPLSPEAKSRATWIYYYVSEVARLSKSPASSSVGVMFSVDISNKHLSLFTP